MDYTKAKMDDVIKRINELYKKSKEEGLTESEKEEQKVLRRRYIDGYKASLINIVSYCRKVNFRF